MVLGFSTMLMGIQDKPLATYFLTLLAVEFASWKGIASTFAKWQKECNASAENGMLLSENNELSVKALVDFLKTFSHPFSKAPWAHPFTGKFIQYVMYIWYVSASDDKVMDLGFSEVSWAQVAIGLAVVVPLMIKKAQSFSLGVSSHGEQREQIKKLKGKLEDYKARFRSLAIPTQDQETSSNDKGKEEEESREFSLKSN